MDSGNKKLLIGLMVKKDIGVTEVIAWLMEKPTQHEQLQSGEQASLSLW